MVGRSPCLLWIKAGVHMNDVGSDGDVNRDRDSQSDARRQDAMIQHGQLPVNDGTPHRFAQPYFIVFDVFDGLT